MSPSSRRAWIETPAGCTDRASTASPSSRRAWIEIRTWTNCAMAAPVALLAEGVDRNSSSSLMRRRTVVALLAEGVDRNKYGQGVPVSCESRPPCGGRG